MKVKTNITTRLTSELFEIKFKRFWLIKGLIKNRRRDPKSPISLLKIFFFLLFEFLTSFEMYQHREWRGKAGG